MANTNECIQKGADAEAIDIVTQARIRDNATSRSLDLASFLFEYTVGPRA